MGLSKQNLIYDEAERIVNENIEKVKNNKIDLKEALKICKQDKYVKQIYEDSLIDMIFSHELKKEFDYGNASEH
jgi:hypothetical protein|tara:strand:+ start:2494 stop:2715 length:222 start_codon:yes stop_codon:yes gene_type:complete